MITAEERLNAVQWAMWRLDMEWSKRTKAYERNQDSYTEGYRDALDWAMQIVGKATR